MMKSTTFIRVRYGEVDQMGFLYYGNYALYYEVARGDMIRNAGYPYNEMERDGTVMPVVKMNAKFLKPALYEQLIRVETTLSLMPKKSFITFIHKLYNEANELLHIGEVTLTFFNPKTQKRVEMPDRLYNILAPYFM